MKSVLSDEISSQNTDKKYCENHKDLNVMTLLNLFGETANGFYYGAPVYIKCDEFCNLYLYMGSDDFFYSILN